MTFDANAEGAASPSVAIVTASFSGDLELCRLLCETVDRFVAPNIEHVLVVPQGDIPYFRDLVDSRRRIEATEAFLPSWFVQVPLPQSKVRNTIPFLRRDVFVTPFSLPVRGWIAQQIVKLGVVLALDVAVVVHVDSDVAFVRPFGPDRLFQGDRVRLRREPAPGEADPHWRWHLAAAELLGLPQSRNFGSDYIDNAVTWRRSVAEALTARIESRFRTDWRVVLARRLHFSEYILYGIFAEHVMGLEAAGHWADEVSLCHTFWMGRMEDTAQMDAFCDNLRQEHVAVGIQSTVPLSLQRRRDLVEALSNGAAANPIKRTARPEGA
jgi:hypothetical protein